MFKTRFISMLVLLMTAVTGAWADADVTWNSSNVSDMRFWGGAPDGLDSYTKEGITLRGNAEYCDATWADYGDGPGINFDMNASGGYTFTAPDGKKFTKIEMTIYSYDGWYNAAYNNWLGSGWPGEDAAMTVYSTNKVTWTGDATSTVDLLTDAGLSSFGGATVSSIDFYFEAPATVAVTGVTLAPTSATLTLGETETVTLTPTVAPGDATDKSVTWSSSNEAVATVTDGVVTAVAAGEATITVTTTDGAKTATCTVTVSNPTYTATFTTDADWSEVYAYAWSGEDPDVTEILGEWPGTKIEATEGVYNLSFTSATLPEKIAFSNGNTGLGNQTEDFDFVDGQVYQYTAPVTYTVTMKDGTEDAGKWEINPANAASGTEITLKYNGKKKVKNITIEKAAAPAATVTTAPTAKTGVKAGQNEAIVNAGTAEGGTMMYMVNATQPASTDGFSATVPTAEGLTAGTYYVWYYVKADDSHTDSEISATGIAVTIASAYTMAAAATSADKGKLICADGHIHAYDADDACTKDRVAMIIYKGTTGHATYNHGLALALTDEGQMAWQAAIDACSAKNTSTPVTNATWLLASKAQWEYMMGTDGAGSHTALHNGFESVGGSNLDSSWWAWYWSSTENEGNADAAWYYDFNNGRWDGDAPKEDGGMYVRACLAF